MSCEQLPESSVMGRDSLAMVFLKDKTLTRYFPDIRTQGVVFVIILFACPAPIYDKDQVLGVAGAGRRSQCAAGRAEGTLFQEQPSMHSRTFQSAKVARHNSIFNLGFTDCLAVFARLTLVCRRWFGFSITVRLN